jgi:hypothetical protein
MNLIKLYTLLNCFFASFLFNINLSKYISINLKDLHLKGIVFLISDQFPSIVFV